ncbi:fatty acid acyl transferase-related [Holotrichia oblita]|uniref:Fatty acid acyl transferase-related n=1 Tax=Holotrichia oblita TaxID=644536 RepID=A0ACB9T1G9_HOLOL|nr:fatty acid acyl transferase-related [Holotrichia oblita]
MAEIWTYIKDTYHYLFVELADPRTNDWLLIKHPVVFPIIAIYLYLVLKVGPKLMEKREPFQMKTLLIFYNFIQVVVSLYIVFEGAQCGWFTDFNFRCEPVDFSYSPRALRIARGCHTYYIAKLSELLDTVFFVMRKKNSQISFLHLYHHSVMPMISWGATKYYPGGHGTFIGMINSFVHIIMYFYYMMSAMGPQYQKYLWWKKYITTLQLLQFCVAFLHSMQLLLYDCGFPRWSTVFTLPNAIFFYYLFSDFYKKAYTPDSPKNDKNANEINGKPATNHLNGDVTTIKDRSITKVNGYINKVRRNSDDSKINGDVHKPKIE